MNITTVALALLALHVAAFPSEAHAVIPPDFIFNVALQATQIFSLVAIMATAAFGAVMQFIKVYFFNLHVRRVFMIVGFVGLIGACFGGSYWYATHLQQSEYDEWLAESLEHEDDAGEAPAIDENDRLQIGAIDNIDASLKTFVSNATSSDDVSTRFINDFFDNVASGNIARAYEMTERRNPLGSFIDYYKNVTKITLDKVTRIDTRKTSVELTLYRGREFVRYGALLTLTVASTTPTFIHKSETRVLASGTYRDEIASARTPPADAPPAQPAKGNSAGTAETAYVKEATTSAPSPIIVVNVEETPTAAQEESYYDAHKDDALMVSNSKFYRALKGSDQYLVLDAREDIEYDNGRFPGSTHIRFADLKAGRWIEMPTDRTVYVICWSGIRGKEVAQFLRTKKIAAVYLENGASGWYDYGGAWDGNIKFAEQYTSAQYTNVIETADVRNLAANGVILVDSREPYKYNKSHVPGSVNIPIMYTPSLKLEETFNQVPPGAKVITICDAYVNCFDAKLTGVELERRGHEFLGRYIKPWEYDQ